MRRVSARGQEGLDPLHLRGQLAGPDSRTTRTASATAGAMLKATSIPATYRGAVLEDP